MSHSVRHLFTAAATVATFAIAAPMAGAAQITTPNACRGDDAQYGDLPLQLAATGTANARQLDVSAITPSVTVPDWLPAKLQPAANLLGAGTHNVKVDAWMAVAGAGSTDAAKTLTTNGTVQIVVTGSFLNYKISSVKLTLGAAAATSWHAPDGGATIGVSQAPAGSLGQIPGGLNGATVTPKGSLYIRGAVSVLGTTQTFLIDCQPGSTGGDGSTLSSTFTPGVAQPIVSQLFDAVGSAPVPTNIPVVNPTPTPTPAAGGATKPTPAPGSGSTQAATVLSIASPTIKFGSAAVLVNVACPTGGSACTGSITLTSAKKLKVGNGPAKVRALGSGTYSVPAGSSIPVKVKLTADGKKLRKKALVAKVTLKPSSGTAVAKNIRANG